MIDPAIDGLDTDDEGGRVDHDSSDDPGVIEPRWPVAVVLTAYIAITLVLRLVEPERGSLSPHWLVPAIEIALLAVLSAANPAHIEGRARWVGRAGGGERRCRPSQRAFAIPLRCRFRGRSRRAPR